MNEIIKLVQVKKTYKYAKDSLFALNRVSLSINEGEFVAILGESGSGKSTLMNIIAGFDRPTSGKVIVDNIDISSLNDKKISAYRNKTIGFVFQSFHLDNSLTACENVMMPLIYAKVPLKMRKEKAEEALKMIKLFQRADSRPSELSGGQCQRVCIARAIVNSPKIILADEPTGNLDKKSGQNVMDILSTLNKKGYTVIMVTHNEKQAMLCNRIIEIADGKIISDTLS